MNLLDMRMQMASGSLSSSISPIFPLPFENFRCVYATLTLCQLV